MSQALSSATATVALIREWVSAVRRAAGPKPMALPYLAAGDPEALARIALRTIHEGILTGDMGLARLALIAGAIAEYEAAGGDGGPDWGTEAQVRVGLSLIDCAMRASAGWLTLDAGPDGRLVVSVVPGAMDAAGHCFGSEAPGADSWRPIVRELAAPFGAIRTLVCGRSVAVAMTETADANLPGGGIELGRAVALGRA